MATGCLHIYKTNPQHKIQTKPTPPTEIQTKPTPPTEMPTKPTSPTEIPWHCGLCITIASEINCKIILAFCCMFDYFLESGGF